MNIQDTCFLNIAQMSLKSFAKTLGVYDIASYVLEDERFEVWSGSGKSYQHHYGKGGLIQHTTEVTNLCFSNRLVLGLGDEVAADELYLSCLFHDCGKMWDYEPVLDDKKDWVGTDHKDKIHHVSRSAIEWNKACANLGGKYAHLVDPVTHNILSHHGQKEWGSPVTPKSKAAWLLHTCDMISARTNDCGKFKG